LDRLVNGEFVVAAAQVAVAAPELGGATFGLDTL
jgi:hypothetical protein